MSKRVWIGIGVGLVVIIAVIAAYVFRPVAEASVPIEALPVDVDQPEVEEEGEEPVEDAQPADDLEPAVEATPTAEAEPVEEVAQPEGIVVFEIVQDGSQVRFTLDELLRGQPKTVVGTTNQVAGEIAVNFDDPASTQVGAILVNARTFVTDSEFRNRAINNEILDTGAYEFITFTPNAIVGFPQNPQVGEALSFQIIGELTIRDVTNEVTFDVTATAESESLMKGYAKTTVSRVDYDLQIPEVRNVANVDEEVLLEIDFVAKVK
jgi:polyisoprenoid-binding protein YceI